MKKICNQNNVKRGTFFLFKLKHKEWKQKCTKTNNNEEMKEKRRKNWKEIHKYKAETRKHIANKWKKKQKLKKGFFFAWTQRICRKNNYEDMSFFCVGFFAWWTYFSEPGALGTRDNGTKLRVMSVCCGDDCW